MKGIIITIGAVALAASVSFGLDEPFKANKYQATAVNAYDACTAPSEFTGGSLALPACPAVDSDGGTCNFGDKGKGKFQAKTKDDVKLQVQLKKLLPACEGLTLQALATITATTNDCTVSSRCTTVTVADLPVPGGTCVVDNGNCKIKLQLNDVLPGTITPGENTSIAIGAVGVQIGTAPAGSKAAVAGVLVP